MLNDKNQIAMVYQFGTSWSLPKGTILENEDHIEAAKRKIHEETGINQLTFIKDLGTYSRSGILNKDITINIHMFLFKTTDTVLKPLNNEHPKAEWVDRENVINILTHPKDKDFFISIINHQ